MISIMRNHNCKLINNSILLFIRYGFIIQIAMCLRVLRDGGRALLQAIELWLEQGLLLAIVLNIDL